MTTTHITYPQMARAFCEWNRSNGITSKGSDKKALQGVVVFASSNWPDMDYSLESRSYLVSSNNKAYIPGMGGYSIFATNLDHTDTCRLETYIEEEGGFWKVDYCYLLDEEVVE